MAPGVQVSVLLAVLYGSTCGGIAEAGSNSPFQLSRPHASTWRRTQCGSSTAAIPPAPARMVRAGSQCTHTHTHARTRAHTHARAHTSNFHADTPRWIDDDALYCLTVLHAEFSHRCNAHLTRCRLITHGLLSSLGLLRVGGPAARCLQRPRTKTARRFATRRPGAPCTSLQQQPATQHNWHQNQRRHHKPPPPGRRLLLLIAAGLLVAGLVLLRTWLHLTANVQSTGLQPNATLRHQHRGCQHAGSRKLLVLRRQTRAGSLESWAENQLNF